MKKIRVYIASPFSKGYQFRNIRRQIDAAHELKILGYYPYIPLLLAYYEIIHHNTEKDMLDWEMSFLEVCDILVRLKPKDDRGIEIPSSGADFEEARARELGIPVFTFETIEEMVKSFKKHKFLLNRKEFKTFVA